VLVPARPKSFAREEEPRERQPVDGRFLAGQRDAGARLSRVREPQLTSVMVDVTALGSGGAERACRTTTRRSDAYFFA
jgi:hypothetical protein